MNRLASLLNSENINPQLISDLHKNKDTTPSKEERARRINATALDAIKAYTPIGWAWSDVQISQRQQTQTPARRTVSTRRKRHTIQRQTESMDTDPGCSNTQPNNPSRQTRTINNPPSSQPNKRQKRNPNHFMELTGNPTASLPNYPEPLQPGDNAATKIWHYKHSTATLFLPLPIGYVDLCVNTLSQTGHTRLCGSLRRMLFLLACMIVMYGVLDSCRQAESSLARCLRFICIF